MGAIDGVTLSPLAKRPMVVTVTDEEGVNFRSSNLLSGPMHVRTFGIPESSHPAWNDTSRALQSSRLKAALLRGTVICNHFRGPFRSGKFQYDLREAAISFLASCNDDTIERLSEDYAFDTGVRNCTLTKELFLDTPGIQTRLPTET